MVDPAIAAAAAKVKADVDALVALVPQPAPPARKLRVGLNNIGSRTFIKGCTEAMIAAGITWDRVDVGTGNMTPVLANQKLGIKTLPVYNPVLEGRNTPLVASEVLTLAKAILPLGLNEIEFGNEVYFNGSYPAEYAAQYNVAHAFLAGMGVTLIANAYGDYQRANGTWSQCTNNGGWTADFINANPGPIDAFSVHPYGTVGQLSSDHRSGELLLPFLHDLAKNLGVDVPWYVTEVGQQAGDRTKQGGAMNQYLNDLILKTSVPGTPFDYVTSWHWYSSTDDNTGQWGIMNVSNQVYTGPRPAFTVLQNWIAANKALLS